jgi:Kef-type K+ transport system membrane component KefB
MCITAFPMLARIIHFKGLSGTTMGTVAIGAGAIDDAAAWSLLAVVMASMSGDVAHAVSNLSLAALYLLLCFALIRPALARWARSIEASGDLTDSQYAFLLSLMCLGAWWTDRIELHAVFGAFIMGACMPRGLVSRRLIERTQPLSVALLLPLFFTYSGLNTKLGLLGQGSLWGWALAVLLAAIAGKGLACWGAARLSGLPNREALGIGILMNARGLMELIIINIGLQRGVIGPELFAMFAIMAVVTTLMASPLFERCVGRMQNGQLMER